MKKKIVALILIVMLISTFFAGCSLFVRNDNRDYHQVVASVNYNTKDSGALTADIYKGEVNTRVNVYAAYLQQYGFGADDIVEYCYNDITRQKLLLLYAQEYLYLNNLLPQGFGYDSLGAWNSFKNADSKNVLTAYRAFLTIDEFRYCIELVNKSFDDQWKDLIEEAEEEADKNKGETSSGDNSEDEDKVEDKDLLTARSKKEAAEDEEDEEYELNESIKNDEDVVKYFADLYDLTMDASSIGNAFFPNYVNALIKKETNDKAKTMKSALRSLQDGMEKQYVDYEYFLVQQMQNYIVEKYTDHIGNTEKVMQEVNNDFEKRYKKLVDSAVESYKNDSSAYNTAVGNKTFAYAAPSKDYLQVKSILLSFTDAQKNAITKLTELNSSNKDIAKILRNAYATGIVPSEYENLSLDVFAELGIKVNVSNPDYDADEDELVNAYTDASIKDKENVYANPSVDYLTVIAAMANDIQSKIDRALSWANANGMSDVEKYLVKQNAAQQAFNDWINLVNDDSGMFSSDVYSVTPEGESTSYVEEYTVLARALTSAGAGAMAIKDYSTTDATDGNINYTGTTDILKGGNGAYTIYKQNNKSSVGEFEEELSADIYTLVTASGAELSFIVNEFGIHIVMVASKPVDENLDSVSERTVTVLEDNKEKEKTFYTKDATSLYEYSVKVEYAKDDDGNDIKTQIEKIIVEKKTIEEYLKELLNEELSSNVTRLQQLNLFSDDTYIVKKDKVYKQLVSALSKQIG